MISGQDVTEALRRGAAGLNGKSDYLTELDQAVGDGDLGITASKAAAALTTYLQTPPEDDLGSYIASAGMAVNRAASSTMGTLLATALMRAGKVVKGKSELSLEDVAEMLHAADVGIQERGKAKPGDKTIIDALHPAAAAFSEAVEQDEGLQEAGEKMVAAARRGLESVTPQRSKIGRAGWVGERTEGRVDPGCAALVILLEAVVEGINK